MDPIKEKEAVTASKRSALLTLAGFLLVFLAFAYSLYELRQLEAKKAELAQEIAENEQLVAVKQAELQQLQGTLDYVRSQLEQADAPSEQVNLAKQALEQVTYEPTEIRPRVYIHLRDSSQVDTAHKLAAALKDRGFVVPKEEILVDKGPNATEVRYFRESEKHMAAEIFAILTKHLGAENARLSYIRGYEDSKAIRPKHYEIWLSKSM